MHSGIWRVLWDSAPFARWYNVASMIRNGFAILKTINVAVEYCLCTIRKALCNRTATIELMAKTDAKLSPAVVVIRRASHCHAIKAGWAKVQPLVAGS